MEIVSWFSGDIVGGEAIFYLRPTIWRLFLTCKLQPFDRRR